ncbi:MAG TPA: adenylate/guanylate cyclase domain-containing protein [Candidatus Binatia bacterium]|nr:adenylate/guanylate cyclase domain-containing protein [Candidatus Binatia bacterium]
MTILKSLPMRAGCVLVVDDEENNRTLLRDTLERRNYEVVEAEDGAAALAFIKKRSPDVVLLDLMMPGMDGFVVCREIKRNPATAAIPVLMVTALSERKERLMGIEAGANDFLNKPVDLQDVILRVGNAVYTKRLYDQVQTEQEKSERLLLNILPERIAQRMKAGETNIAEMYLDVTVLFADLVGFTSLAAHVPVQELLALLNEVFTAFDALTARRGLEKIKTIGDAYMAAGGLTPEQRDSSACAATLALDMQQEITRINGQYNTSLRLSVGINQGPVIAGVIGQAKLTYDLWGDTVNIASRLESLGQPGSIQISQNVYERVKDAFQCLRHDLTDKTGRVIPSFLLLRPGSTELRRKAA